MSFFEFLLQPYFSFATIKAFLLTVAKLFFGLCLLILVDFQSVFAQKFVRLPSSINSSAEELAPVFSQGGDTLFFVRNQHSQNIGNQDIWYSVRQADGTWGVARNIGSPLNNESENAVNGISADGKTLYLNNVYRGKKMIPGLSASTFDAKRGWEMPRKVPITGLNLSAGFIGFSFPAAADTIMLISMENGEHGEDLFFSHKNRYGEWEEPVSLGDVINTDSTEFAPFLAKDGKTLYFASSGHGGFGDVDIFKTTRLDESWQRWSKPKNLGKNINTAGFEAYFVVNPKDDNAYFVRDTDEQNESDIWKIDLNDITDTLTKSPPVLASNQSQLPLPESLHPLPPIEHLSGIVLFEYKSAALSDTAQHIIDQMVEQLLNFSKTQFSITGYADAVGENTPNLKLSEERALAVKVYLMSKGVAAAKISTQAQGEAYATNPKAPDAVRKQERRVEIVVREFR